MSAGVAHFVWSTLEDTRPLTKGLLEPITGPYTVGGCTPMASLAHVKQPAAATECKCKYLLAAVA